MQRRRPRASWLRQVESYRKDMTGFSSTWAMARRRLKKYRRKMDAATRCSGVRLIHDVTSISSSFVRPGDRPSKPV